MSVLDMFLGGALAFLVMVLGLIVWCWCRNEPVLVQPFACPRCQYTETVVMAERV